MANNYNGNRRIPVVFAADGAARLVVRRETWADLLARGRRVRRGGAMASLREQVLRRKP